MTARDRGILATLATHRITATSHLCEECGEEFTRISLGLKGSILASVDATTCHDCQLERTTANV